ncbi:HAD family phosphatase [Kitasatospora sp. MBT63]|uniref:HAD family hydrolase n=1 Tax=Kitasatospora sp. MBT63 TaxID=1444768 RepID=UPI00068983F4|nr:HAD-IB family hydrolase [Kitasatospora sp. MBT63]
MRAAFFDVDETLIHPKSMFSFLEFYLWWRGRPEETYQRLAGELRAAAAQGVPRQEINRRYYRYYAGESAERLTAAGEAWFAREVERGLFVPRTVAEFALRRGTGARTVLVSGSFFAPLQPIAAQLQADWTFCTRPVIRRGELTGEVTVPVIGEVKGRIARHAATILGIDLAASCAYGDHASDLPLLEAVGHPVVVGDDPVLTARAEAANWRRLSITEVPAG